MARPFGILKYSNVVDLDNGIDNYFADCAERDAPYTLSGLAFWLNIDSKTLYNYGKDDSCYFPSISRARERCRQYAHESLYDRDKSRGAQFDLSANYGMSERTQIDLGNAGDKPLQIASLSEVDLQVRLMALGLLSKDNAIMIDE